ncbi:MAG: DUF1015 domain-containing protein [bacterium]
MNSFLPFIGTRYNSDLVKIKDVVAPPYDVISTERQKELYDASPFNVIRLELNHDADPYESAKTIFADWHEANVIIPDASAAFYVYYQTFHTPEGEQVTRRGVLGKLRLSNYSEGNVLPHEQTLSGPKKDRTKLLSLTQTQFSPIFGLISDESEVFDHVIDSVVAQAPLVDIDETMSTASGVRHTMWKLDDEIIIKRIEAIIASQKIIIADGHHRYETAVAYAQEHPENEAAQFIMIFISNLQAEGTVILPTHRILHSLNKFNQFKFLAELQKKFTVEMFPNRETGIAAMENSTDAITLIQFPEEPNFVLVRDSRESLSALHKLPVYRLHEEILKSIAGLTQAEIDAKTNLYYPHTFSETDDMISRAEYNAIFYLQQATAEEVIAVTAQSEFMPQKSTYFYPKLLTGLVFYEFGVQE